MGTPVQPVYRFDRFEADLRSGELRQNGRRVKLQEQPFQVLLLLLERAGEVVTREELQHQLWPSDTFVDFEDGLNTAVKKLRDALGDSAEQPRFIQTLPKRGYRFVFPVDKTPSKNTGTPKFAAMRSLHWMTAVFLAVFLLLGILVTRNVLGIRDRLFTRVKVDSLAVLPLRNVSGDPAEDHIAEGMTEMLITELAKIEAVDVMSHQSVLRYKGSSKPLAEVAAELRVDAILEGTVFRFGERVRVTINLVQAAPERHLLSTSYERDLSDMITVQGEIAGSVADRIEVHLRPDEQARLRNSKSVNPEALEAYWWGRYHFNRGKASERPRAKAFFEQAIDKEPSFAPAYASLAELYVSGGAVVKGPLEGRTAARKWATKALELDDTLAEAHTALAFADMADWDWTSAEREFRRAIELNPRYALARIWFAWYLEAMLRSDEALSQVEIALQLEPNSAFITYRAGFLYFAAHRVGEARACWRRVIELEPGNISAHVGFATAYISEGKYDDAIVELEGRITAGERAPFALGTLACAYGFAGRREEAFRLLTTLRQRRAEGENVPPDALAYAHVGLGERDDAFTWLWKDYTEHRWMFAVASDRMFDPLRSDPRFRDLLQRAGLPQRQEAQVQIKLDK